MGMTISRKDITLACITMFMIGKWKLNCRELISEIRWSIFPAKVAANNLIFNDFKPKLKIKAVKTEFFYCTAAFSTFLEKFEEFICFTIYVFKTVVLFKKAKGALDYLKIL